MNYHNIKKDDMLNGSGLRVTLFISGCDHHCKNCHNPQTWNVDGGIPFAEEDKKELYSLLDSDYIKGLTLSGGDPLHQDNVSDVLNLVKEIKDKFTNKDIWLYTGYKYEELTFKEISPNYFEEINNIKRREILEYVDVLVDGMFQEDLSDINYHWCGSTNQRVIDVKKSLLSNNEVILWKEHTN